MEERHENGRKTKDVLGYGKGQERKAFWGAGGMQKSSQNIGFWQKLKSREAGFSRYSFLREKNNLRIRTKGERRRKRATKRRECMILILLELERGEKHKDVSEEERFRETLVNRVERKGLDLLLLDLTDRGFFEAPASTKYHGNYAGGLVEHSNHVCERLLQMEINERKKRPDRTCYHAETLVLVSLLHDICKASAYQADTVKGFVYNTRDLPYGHGEKSVYMIQKHIELTDEEALAIRWHMGAYDTAARADLRDLSRAMDQSELVVMLHLADMMATRMDERQGC